MACNVCGQDYLRCNCVSQQPYCEQCSEDNPCAEEMNAACVVYHPDNESPSLLLNLGLPNITPVEDILEAIDARLGSIIASTDPNTATDTSTIDITLSGVNNRAIQASVKISSVSGNEISIKPDGIYSAYSGRVKVDATDALDYLEAQIVGGSADPYVQCTVQKDTGVLEVIPTLNFNALREDLGLETTAVQDTNSINLSSTVVLGTNTIQADAKISATAGNIITINPDGLYVPTPSSTTITADNGLTKTGNNIQLGGALIQATTLDFGAAQQLNFTNSPRINIGSSTTVTADMYVQGSTSDAAVANMINFFAEAPLNNTDYITLSAFKKITGTGFSQSGNNYTFGTAGQLWYAGTGAHTLSGSAVDAFSGLYGSVIKSGTSNTTGNKLSAGFFSAYAADSGNVSDMACIRLAALNNPPSEFGGVYTGTITNMYGMYIENIAGSPRGANITNKYAIYQLGPSDISRFFGPVQNASSTTQFTSDERVKENITSFTRGLNEIKQINTKKFNYTYHPNRTVTGIIAQELENIIPEAVEQGNFSTPDGQQSFTDFRMVDQTTLFYTMLNAIKELAAKVEVLENNL